MWRLLFVTFFWLVSTTALLASFDGEDMLGFAVVCLAIGWLFWRSWLKTDQGRAPVTPDITQTPHSRAPETPPVNNTPVAITEQQAEQFWQEIVDLADLTWDIANTGCEARADLVAEIAHNKGWQPKKIWMLTYSYGHLWAYLNKAQTESAGWAFHVAVVLPVERDQASQQLVFDPTLFDSPVDYTTWCQRFCGGDQEGIYHAVESWGSYFGHADMLVSGYRDKALASRSKTLATLKNLDDDLVFEGKLQYRRGQMLDQLAEDNPKECRAMRNLIGKSSVWFSAKIRSHDFNKMLQQHSHYYGLPTSTLLEALDFEDPFVYLAFVFRYWREVDFALTKLDKTATKLMKSEPYRFGEKWQSDNGSPLRTGWFLPFSHSLWQDWGITPQDLLPK